MIRLHTCNLSAELFEAGDSYIVGKSGLCSKILPFSNRTKIYPHFFFKRQTQLTRSNTIKSDGTHVLPDTQEAEAGGLLGLDSIVRPILKKVNKDCKSEQDGSAAKSTLCSCRGTKFRSQQ
jgi:hypothetical protein